MKVDSFKLEYGRYTLLAMLLWGAVAAQSQAAPSISSLSGAFVDGGSVTIGGSGFGTKSAATPLIWDDFENGTVGNLVGNGWNLSRDGGDRPVYSDQQSYGKGTTSLTNHVELDVNQAPGCQFCSAYQEVTESTQLYTSYMFRFDVTGNKYGVLKLGRLASTPNDSVEHYNGTGTLKYQYQPQAGWGYVNLESSPDDNLQKTIAGVPAGNWHRVEMYLKLSQPSGQPNGEAFVIVNNDLSSAFMIEDAVTLESGYDVKLHSLLLPLMLANPREDGAFDLYVDDVYLDNTLARVEIGNASTWANSTHREIQIPSAWSDDSITVTVNQGSFKGQDQLYLYVVDANGNVNEHGIPLSIPEPSTLGLLGAAAIWGVGRRRRTA